MSIFQELVYLKNVVIERILKYFFLNKFIIELFYQAIENQICGKIHYHCSQKIE